MEEKAVRKAKEGCTDSVEMMASWPLCWLAAHLHGCKSPVWSSLACIILNGLQIKINK